MSKLEHLYQLKQSAAQHLKNKKYTQSAVYLRDILAQFPTAIQSVTSQAYMQKCIRQLKISSHKNLTLCYLSLDMNQKCINQCLTVLDLQPNSVKILFRISKAYINIGQYHQAEGYLRRAFHLDPHQKEIMKLLETIQTNKRQMNIVKPQRGRISSLIWFIVYFVVGIVIWIMPRTQRIFERIGLQPPNKTSDNNQTKRK